MIYSRIAIFYLGLTIFGLTQLFGCKSKPALTDQDIASEEHIIKNDDPSTLNKSDIEEFRLWHTIDQFSLDKFDFFGGFYDDRLKFFYTQNIDIQIGAADVKLIILYFLDDRLVKIRYHLDRNVENYLMDSLGLGILKSRYSRNKQIIATEKSLRKLKDYNLAKKDPDIYEISWDRHVIYSSFKVNTYSTDHFSFDTISAKYVYIDQLKSFRQRLIEIENTRLARTNIEQAAGG